MPAASSCTFECHPRSAGSARHWAAAALGERTDADILETITLLISEVVTNALPHCASEIEVVVQVLGDRVRVEVWDEDGDGELTPVVRAVPSDDEHGRGLQLVDSLAEEWGVIRSGPKKAIWFEIASRAPP